MKQNLSFEQRLLVQKHKANHLKSQSSPSSCVINIISNSGSMVLEKGMRTKCAQPSESEVAEQRRKSSNRHRNTVWT